jgi:hypothetical protein
MHYRMQRKNKQEQTPWPLVRKRTKPIERPPTIEYKQNKLRGL